MDLNTLDKNQQTAVLSDSRYITLTAAAGTGKTTVLVERFVRLLEKDRLDLDQIVALTFTRNAAAEMLQRVRERALDKYKSSSGKLRKYWAATYRKMDAARIHTFDSFYSRILRRFAFEAGLDPEFRILDETTHMGNILEDEFRGLAAKLREQKDVDFALLCKWFDIGKLGESVIIELFKKRKKFHEFFNYNINNAPELPFAKWELFTDYVDKYPQVLARDHQWLSLFSDVKRFIETCGEPRFEDEKTQKKINKLIERIRGIDSFGERFSRSNNITSENLLIFFHDVVKKKLNKDSIVFDAYPSSESARLIINGLVKVGERYNNMIKAKDDGFSGDYESVYRSISSVYFKYEKRMNDYRLRRSELDYTDLTLHMRKLIFNNDNILRQLKSGIRHLLVDEFQDTDGAQLGIITAITDLNSPKSKTKGAPHPSLFVVGDEKQSIYRFRGADVTVFKKLRDLVKKAEGEEIRLDLNFRSTGDLVQFHNHLFPTFIPTTELNDYEAVYTPAKSSQERKNKLSVEFLMQQDPDSGRKKTLPPMEEAGRRLNHEHIIEEGKGINLLRKYEAEIITARINNFVGSGEKIIRVGEGVRAVKYGDIALLFNAMTHFSIYERELIRNGIPYKRLGASDFFLTPEIVDVINLLSTLANPYNSISLAGLLRSPLFGISDDTLVSLCVDRKGVLLWDLLDSAPKEIVEESEQQESLRRTASILGVLLKNRDFTPLNEYVNESLEGAHFLEIYSGITGGEERLLNISNLVDFIIPSLISSGFNTLRKLSGELVLMQQRGAEAKKGTLIKSEGEEDGENAIIITTIHKSKGLQYPIVFIPNLSQRKTERGEIAVNPDYGVGLKLRQYNETSLKYEDYKPLQYHVIKDIDIRQEVAEKKRLLYVAATRAKDYLLFSGALISDDRIPYIQHLKDFFPGGVYFENESPEMRNMVKTEVKSLEERDAPPAEIMDAEQDSDESELSSLDFDLLRTEPVSIALGRKARFAPTELADYAACPRFYYYRYLKKFPEKSTGFTGERRAEAGRQIGTIVHKALEIYHGEEPPENEYGLLDKLALDREKAVREIKNMLANYRNDSLYMEIRDADEVWREQDFIYKLNEFLIEGKIDLVFRSGKTVHIVDFKTDSISKDDAPERAKHHSSQMEAYSIAAAKLFGSDEVVYSLMFLRPGVTFTRKMSANDLIKAEQTQSSLVENICTDCEWKGKSGECECGYLHICEDRESVDSG